ncbi:hypothetical protein Q8A73_023708 [Channa argus]|nr:hypothetical protein Q8A73_023708 [Channa argus]
MAWLDMGKRDNRSKYSQMMARMRKTSSQSALSCWCELLLQTSLSSVYRRCCQFSKCRMYSFMGGGLFCAGVGNILLIVSTATDYWMQYRQSNKYMHQGLWRYCMPGKCFPHNDSIAHLDATRALMILSLLACFIGIIIGIMAFIHYSSFDRFDKTFAAGILFFISCFLVLLAMAVYTGVTVAYYGKHYGNWRFSWSYIIGWVSVVLTFFSAAFQINCDADAGALLIWNAFALFTSSEGASANQNAERLPRRAPPPI